jgi:hypothetical protein
MPAPGEELEQATSLSCDGKKAQPIAKAFKGRVEPVRASALPRSAVGKANGILDSHISTMIR